jgi:3',5'-cyclic AMP phosphodiesterase CpdA
MARLSVLGLLGIFLFAPACSSSDEDAPAKPTPDAPLRLTSEATLAPNVARLDPADARSPAVPDDRAAMIKEGFGAWADGPAEPHQTKTPPGVSAPAVGVAPKRLLRFVHMPDLQLADDESPTRLCGFDAPGLFSPAFRPQDSNICHMLNAAVKSVNELHSTDPIDFLMLGGDNADSAQENEVGWVLSILSGADSVQCDSGDDDDPRKGPNNDGKDAFKAPGLDVPWKWVTGNHDILVQGNLPLSPGKNAEAIGSTSVAGTRNWAEPGGPVVKGDVVADPLRRLLDRAEVMSAVASDGDGHGLGNEQVQSGKAIYTFDVAGTDLRFLVLDTAAETGGSDGLLRQGDVDTVIKPALDKAVADGKIVILNSHHAVASLGDGTGLGGKQQADAVLGPAWLSFVSGYPNVRFSMVGHSHANKVRYLETTPGAGYWEVMTSALADFPHQLRILEIWDQDNGFLMMRATNVDFATYGDAVAKEGRALGILDFVSGWGDGEGSGTPEDRNVEIWIEKPKP